MDPELLRQREAFKRRAQAMPTVEKRKARPDEPHKASKKAKLAPKPKAPSDINYKSMSGSSQFKFGILAKIVKHMKVRHQHGDGFPLTVDDILDETNQTDIGVKHKHWLATEALLNNPKIEVVDGDKFKYKPVYNIKDRKGLLRLLDKNDQRGLGGVFLENVEESLPNVDKALKHLGDQVIYYTRSHDKRKVLFYNDKSYNFSVDEEIQKLWRGVGVEGIDEKKIEEYLNKQGITSMQDTVQRAPPGPKRRKMANKRKNKVVQKDNEHMGDVLKDYSENQK